MRSLILLGLLISSFVKSYAGDLTTVNLGTSTNSITVPDGKILEVVTFPSGITAYYTTGNGSGISFPVYSQYMYGGIYKFAGPGVLSNSSGQCGVTYRLVDNASTTTTTPTSAVVIPTDATGPVNVILESSTDLVTWTAANPGTYGASTTKRFFRVRAVNQSFTPELPSL
jgi:hypothetical protein